MSAPELNQQRASDKLYELAGFVRGLGSEPTDIRPYEAVNKEFRETRQAISAVAGLAIVGNSGGQEYFSFRLPVYKRELLTRHQYTGNDFRGIVRRLVNLDMPTLSGSTKRLCLQVAPLITAVNQEWIEYYRERGWDNQLNHPFGREFYAGKSVWVPIDTMTERKIFFPQTPEESTATPERVRV